jgi:protein-S-isoprenylcysteine O-methyltransferase Ste14
MLASTAALALILWLWQPLTATVWHAPDGGPAVAFRALYLAGWGFLTLSTFSLGHFDLFGLRQALTRDYAEPGFRVPFLYSIVRHPIMVGFFVIFWATPRMSAGHLLFAVLSTAYILVGVRFEEHDLKRQLGAPYEQYLTRVPRFVPGTGKVGRDRTPAGR